MLDIPGLGLEFGGRETGFDRKDTVLPTPRVLHGVCTELEQSGDSKEDALVALPGHRT